MNSDPPVTEANHNNSALRAQASEQVGRAVIALIREEPFFGHLLSGINRKFTSDTSKVKMSFQSGRPVLSVNPEYFVNELPTPGQTSAAIKQATLALLLNHRARFNATDMDAQLFEMASNVVVNQLIGDKWPMPPESLGIDSFEFSMPPDMTLEWYYNQLWEHRDEIPEELKPEASEDDHTDGQQDQDDQQEPIARHELAKALRDAKDRSGEDDFPLIPIEVQELVESMIDDLQPSVDWRRVIRLFNSSSQRTRVSNTLRRPSKRYGTYPGIKVKRLYRLAVIIDTSGSVNTEFFGEFFAEIHGIWRQGAHVTVVEADNTVRKSWEYRGERPPSTRGRGGTQFDPALAWVAAAVPAFDAAIYFTDGLAPSPTVRPGCEVLWVLPEDGDDGALRGYRTIKLAS